MGNGIALEKTDGIEVNVSVGKNFFRKLYFFIFWLRAKYIQILTGILGPKKIDVAFISNVRDEIDAKNFGFSFKKFRCFPWIKYEWSSGKKIIRGQLFMIGCVHPQMHEEENRNESQQLLLEAIKKGIKEGATLFLLAANTKNLFSLAGLKEKFPAVDFTLGDNLTAVLIEQRIKQAFKDSGLEPREAKVLILAPYGILGKPIFEFIKTLGCREIIGLGPRENLMEQIQKRFSEKNTIFTVASSFDKKKDAQNLQGIDLVIPCDSNKQWCQLTPERIRQIKPDGQELIVINFCEPPNPSKQDWEEIRNEVICYDAGNGYSKNLKCVLKKTAYRILRLDTGVTWGCFAETFVLSANPELLADGDWFSINKKNMEIMEKFIGEGDGKFSLPPATTFLRPI